MSRGKTRGWKVGRPRRGRRIQLDGAYSAGGALGEHALPQNFIVPELMATRGTKCAGG